MTDQIKQFIEKYIQLIDTNNFEALYQIAIKEGIIIHHLTEVLLKAEIEPLFYMDKVPNEYYPVANVNDQIILPPHIKGIGSYAYGDTKIKSINLPEGLLSIGGWAFACTSLLTDIVLPSTLENIGPGCFENSNLKSILYNGTVKEFYKIQIWDEPFANIPCTIIKCKDGDIRIKDLQ